METVQHSDLSRSEEIQAEIRKLVEKQKPATVHGIDGTIISSLVEFLSQQQHFKSYRAAVAGDVDHFQTERDDAGWGCGWRNIQMVCSHLLRHDEEMQESLFEGCGFVPDVLFLQAWLEIAWKAGYDVAGGDMLGNAMQGSHRWIGTTECAALLRFFGLRAHIIDFTGGLKNPNIQANERGEQMHMGVACDNCGQCPIVGQRFNSQVVNNYDLCERCHELPGAQHVAPFRLVQNEEAKHSKAGVTVNRELADLNQQNTEPHLRLMEWVWNYFADGNAVDPGPSAGHAGMDSKSKDAGATHSQPSKQAEGDIHWEKQQGRKSKLQKRGDHGRSDGEEPAGADAEPFRDDPLRAPVTKSGKPPLYFQHEGHSRTIIGVERFKADESMRKSKMRQSPNADGFTYNLLLLDPSFKTKDLAAAFKSGRDWQRLLKQGADNLRSQQYQLLYVDDGILQGHQREDWKVLKAAETY